MDCRLHRLDGKTAIITGAGQGIGAAIAHAFAAEDANVVLTGRTLSKLESVSAEIRSELPEAKLLCLPCDITDTAQIARVVSASQTEFGSVHVLVNNAGMNVFHEPLEISEEEWHKCLNNDLFGAWNFAKAVLPAMKVQRSGSIINISSVHAHKIIPHCFPYPVAKHGLIGLTKALGIEYAPYNIRVNSISPGLIETPMSFDWYQAMVAEGAASTVEEFRQIQANILPCKRIGRPEEVAMTCVFLASDEAPFINATDILIDGGRSALYHD